MLKDYVRVGDYVDMMLGDGSYVGGSIMEMGDNYMMVDGTLGEEPCVHVEFNKIVVLLRKKRRGEVTEDDYDFVTVM